MKRTMDLCNGNPGRYSGNSTFHYTSDKLLSKARAGRTCFQSGWRMGGCLQFRMFCVKHSKKSFTMKVFFSLCKKKNRIAKLCYFLRRWHNLALLIFCFIEKEEKYTKKKEKIYIDYVIMNLMDLPNFSMHQKRDITLRVLSMVKRNNIAKNWYLHKNKVTPMYEVYSRAGQHCQRWSHE